MSFQTSVDVFDRARDLRIAERYREALDVLVENQDAFPEESYRLIHWQVCMAALGGMNQVAMDILERALQQGEWYSEGLLRDPDLTSLWGDARFEALLARSCEMAREVQERTKPEAEVFVPDRPAPFPLVVALHGNNSNAALTRPFWQPAVPAGWMVALPLSTQLIGKDRAVWDDRSQGIVEVRDHLARLQAAYPVDPDRIVLGGFSMGGQLAAWMAVSGVVKVRGFYVVAPYISDLEEWSGLIENAASHDLRVGFLLGAEDTVSGKTPEELAQRLRAAGVPCELDIIPGLRHAYPPDFAARLAKMLEYICQA